MKFDNWSSLSFPSFLKREASIPPLSLLLGVGYLTVPPPTELYGVRKLSQMVVLRVISDVSGSVASLVVSCRGGRELRSMMTVVRLFCVPFLPLSLFW